MSKAAIIGSGLIGRAWALVFARAGWQVAMTDTSDSLLATLPQQLLDDCLVLEQNGLCGPAGEVVSNIVISSDIADAVTDVDFVQENGPEDCDIKQAIFAELDQHTPQAAILASSTSAIVASRFTEGLAGRSRCLVGHPVNPPHLVPLVEICPAPWTDSNAIEKARKIYLDVGQVPIVLNREIDGFVLNRLQGALLAEAFRLVRDGVVSPQDLDHTLKDGLGLRWSFMGPFETIDLNAPGGIADYCDRYCGFYERIADDPPKSKVFGEDSKRAILESWPDNHEAGYLAEKTHWRNQRLAALLAHKKTQLK